MTEAAFRLGGKAEVLCPEINWRDIRGFGNKLRHEYDGLIDSRIWHTIERDLPVVRQAVMAGLERYKAGLPIT